MVRASTHKLRKFYLMKIILIAVISLLLFNLLPTSCWSKPKYILTPQDSRSSIQKIGKLNVLNLYGTREEVAYQHGFYARELVQKGESALNHYIPLIKNSILNATNSSFKGQLYATYVDTILTSRFVSATIPTRDQTVYAALASGAGISDVKDIFRAALYPDIGQYLLGKAAEGENYNYIKHLPTYGCTTLIAKSSIAKSSGSENSELMGRNFDFSSFGSYEKNAAIVYIHPSEPEDQQYVMFTSLGLHSAHTTWNESGIFLSLHQLLVNDNHIEGTSILSITDEITRRAHSLKEAQSIIEGHGITSSWRIILHSTKEHRTLLADISATHKAFKSIDDNIHFFTNHVFDTELAKLQYFPYYNYGWDSLSRFNYLKQKTMDLAALSEQQMVDLMSSREYILSDKSIIQKHIGAIAKQSNLMSVIIDSGKNRVFFATSNNDFELSPSGAYQELSLDFSMNWLEQAKVKIPSVLVTQNILSNEFLQSEILLRKAESQYEKRESLENLLPLIERAYSLSTNDINIALLKSGIELRLYGYDNKRSDLFAAARTTLETLAANPAIEDHEKHPTELARLLLARTYVLSGNYDQAYKILRNWKGETSPYINTNATKDLNLLERNEKNITELRKVFNESLQRLTFEISDIDISTL
jgi:hypothetical protein